MSARLPIVSDTSRLAVDFAAILAQHGLAPLQGTAITTVQINVGALCNQACHHCHVEAGPKRTEVMSREVAERIVSLIDTSPEIAVVDITGGAPELNPSFRWLVEAVRQRGREVIDRCNLTILFEDGQADLASFLAKNKVHVVASLPCYNRDNVEVQRGKGVFAKSIAGLRLLNEFGYGQMGTDLQLDLVYNPLGPVLPPPQLALEEDYKRRLADDFGIKFSRLYTITNMPIRRFAHVLEREGKWDEYMTLLVNHFNPETVPALMCRSLVSVGYDGRLYDCDFNQMLDIPFDNGALDAGAGADALATVWELDSFAELRGRRIATGGHCLGCTAGAGSSCGGSIAKSSVNGRDRDGGNLEQ